MQLLRCMFLSGAVILLTFLTFTESFRNLDDLKIGDLPDDIISDIYTIVTRGSVTTLVRQCAPVRETDFDVIFYLYNRENQESPTIISKTNITSMDAETPIILLVHGWLSSAFTRGIQILKDAYLQKYDWNVIVVDWSKLTNYNYDTTYCHLPEISRTVGEFLCEISEQLNVKLNSVRMIGHSMGAHLSGIAGQIIESTCGQKLGRITGLDPAGPMYINTSTTVRLDENDAEFVDVIHTNAIYFGYPEACGSVDFYPNCGLLQPQCATKTGPTSLTQIKSASLSFVSCHHSMSWYYMADSVIENPNKFQATSCDTCLAMVCLPDLSNQNHSVMGENTPITGINSEYKKFKLILESSSYNMPE